MAIGWYLVVSAIIFCIGAGGVLVRRNPLVILLCLELMLNGANLALVAFARMWGGEDGQIFALIVMVVAACEVTVGPRPGRGASTAGGCRSTSTSSASCRDEDFDFSFGDRRRPCLPIAHDPRGAAG